MTINSSGWRAALIHVFCGRGNKRLLVIASGLLACCFGTQHTATADPLEFRFLGSDFSYWGAIYSGHGGPSETDPNPRIFVFTPPQAFPTKFVSETNLYETWSGEPFTAGTNFPFDARASRDWPNMTNGFFIIQGCGNTSTDTVAVNIELTPDYRLWQMPPGSTPADAVQVAINYWKTNGALPNANFLTADTPIKFHATGGYYDGGTYTLPAAVGYAAASPPGGDAHNQSAISDFILAVDWGNDLLTNREFMIFHMQMLASGGGGYECLSLPNQCMQWLGQPDVLAFENHVISSLLSQIASGEAFMKGALPEQLFLYDFSMEHTLQPFKTLPTLLQGFLPAVDPAEVDQYDAGMEDGLPTASYDARMGGNACGPMSLMMALNAAGSDTYDINEVYANTMQHPPANGIDNSFLWPRAKAWLEGKAIYENESGGIPFPSPRAGHLPVDYLQQKGGKLTAWNKVDALLGKKQPVVLRTDLGAGDIPGSGHVILLLGKGSSDRVAELYGTSGDYYVVADPAGHFIANPKAGKHYLRAEQLTDQMVGINYGGWFAMYPSELVRARITIAEVESGITNYIPMVRALTIGASFSSALQLQAKSPVAIMVTDPAGKQTGVQPDGTVVEGIPESSYEPPAGDSEDGNFIDPTGPKTVRIDTPMAGTYTIDLTGTNAGNYTLEAMQAGTNGGLATNTFTGSITPGQKVTYQFTAVPSGPPPLLSALHGNALGLFWTTNYAGYTLQSNGNLSNPNGWSAVGGVSDNGAFNVHTNSNPTGMRFYRLTK